MLRASLVRRSVLPTRSLLVPLHSRALFTGPEDWNRRATWKDKAKASAVVVAGVGVFAVASSVALGAVITGMIGLGAYGLYRNFRPDPTMKQWNNKMNNALFQSIPRSRMRGINPLTTGMPLVLQGLMTGLFSLFGGAMKQSWNRLSSIQSTINEQMQNSPSIVRVLGSNAQVSTAEQVMEQTVNGVGIVQAVFPVIGIPSAHVRVKVAIDANEKLTYQQLLYVNPRTGENIDLLYSSSKQKIILIQIANPSSFFKMEQSPLIRSRNSIRTMPTKLEKAAITIGLFAALSIASVAFSLRNAHQAPLLKKSQDFTGDLRQRCIESYYKQTLDHFGAISATYDQRYFVCSEFWTKPSGPIFFYVGNEADVELYLNHTGLMWENAQEYGALLVFAEHRYFGKSVPFGKDAVHHLQYLSSEQALADYAVLISYLKESLDASKSAVIGFGGSYGGMLASWFRIKYPHIIDGVIAGSAPVLSFLGEDPPTNVSAFSQIVTFDASPGAGSVPNCASNVRRAWDVIFNASTSSSGRAMLQETLGLCDAVSTEAASRALADWAKGAFDYLAMGNYPYPSSYIMNGMSVLPAYPVRAACLPFEPTFPETPEGDQALLRAMRNGVGVYYNSTKDIPCYSMNQPSNESQIDGEFWDYLFCSELYQPQDQGNGLDMFWTVLHNVTADAERCMRVWNVTLRPYWATTVYGGRKALHASSNIVFSNGNFDPWSGMGVLQDLNPSVVAVPVVGGAHHLDLMFSHELDTPEVLHARAVEKKHIWKWIRQAQRA
ncbi:lysosomal Pro-X carboxypeptidase [Thraustotheca clavata]|uniref:Lysosomal Pro-X carboxypeptidase n=1 Tax=Thraustotheca clavata TaxID=74557 RepID=A0A1W0A252_9STRA|nr:lysosomal Pro-X carboxypeptidase [Thraustotheca clavata]